MYTNVYSSCMCNSEKIIQMSINQRKIIILWCTRTMQYDSVIKLYNQLMLWTTWINLKINILHERSQTKKTKKSKQASNNSTYCTISFIYNSRKCQLMYSDRKQNKVACECKKGCKGHDEISQNDECVHYLGCSGGFTSIIEIAKQKVVPRESPTSLRSERMGCSLGKFAPFVAGRSLASPVPGGWPRIQSVRWRAC